MDAKQAHTGGQAGGEERKGTPIAEVGPGAVELPLPPCAPHGRCAAVGSEGGPRGGSRGGGGVEENDGDLPFEVSLSIDRGLYGVHTLTFEVGWKCPASASRDPMHLLLCVDTSGSMSDNLWMEKAKEALGCVIDMVHDSSTEVTLVTFDQNAVTRIRLASRARPGTIESLVSKIKSLKPGGQTDIRKALVHSVHEMAAARSGTDQRQVVMLITDGYANEGTKDAKEMARAFASSCSSHGVKPEMHCFGISHEHNDATLAGLAVATEGSYHRVLSTGDIPEVVSRVFSSIRGTGAMGVRLFISPASPECTISDASGAGVRREWAIAPHRLAEGERGGGDRSDRRGGSLTPGKPFDVADGEGDGDGEDAGNKKREEQEKKERETYEDDENEAGRGRDGEGGGTQRGGTAADDSRHELVRKPAPEVIDALTTMAVDLLFPDDRHRCFISFEPAERWDPLPERDAGARRPMFEYRVGYRVPSSSPDGDTRERFTPPVVYIETPDFPLVGEKGRSRGRASALTVWTESDEGRITGGISFAGPNGTATPRTREHQRPHGSLARFALARGSSCGKETPAPLGPDKPSPEEAKIAGGKCDVAAASGSGREFALAPPPRMSSADEVRTMSSRDEVVPALEMDAPTARSGPPPPQPSPETEPFDPPPTDGHDPFPDGPVGELLEQFKSELKAALPKMRSVVRFTAGVAELEDAVERLCNAASHRGCRDHPRVIGVVERSKRWTEERSIALSERAATTCMGSPDVNIDHFFA